MVADSKFATIELTQELDKKNIMFVLSCGKARPSYLWKNGLHQGLQKGMEKVAKRDSILAVSTFSRKKVNLLTNAFSLGHTTHYKPSQVLEYYDANKHYVDDFNRYLAEYYYDHHHYKWTQVVFDGLLKMAVTNAFVIHQCVAHDQLSYREFLEVLITDLIRRKK